MTTIKDVQKFYYETWTEKNEKYIRTWQTYWTSKTSPTAFDFISKAPNILLRQGSLKRTRFYGFNFIERDSFSPYADLEGVKEGKIKAYIIKPNVKIYDISGETPKDTEDFINIVKEYYPRLYPKTKTILEEGGISYMDVEENEIDKLALKLKIDCLKYYEWEDLPNDPSCVLIFKPKNVIDAEKFWNRHHL